MMALWYRCCDRTNPTLMWGFTQAAIGSHTLWLSYSMVIGEHKKSKRNKTCSPGTVQGIMLKQWQNRQKITQTPVDFSLFGKICRQTGLLQLLKKKKVKSLAHKIKTPDTLRIPCNSTSTVLLHGMDAGKCWHVLGQTLADRAADCWSTIVLNTSLNPKDCELEKWVRTVAFTFK